MNRKIIYILTVGAAILGLLSGCSNASDKAPEQLDTAIRSDTVSATTVVELSNTYTTRFSDVNQITAPTFTFSYPDGWSIESETVDPTSEEVILSNPSGVTITYWNFGGMRDLTGPTREINEVTVEQVADASFIPGTIQATDYSDLGRFMVAKIEIIGQYDTYSGGDYTPVENGSVRYALLPKDQAGETQECIIPLLPTFSFWYGGHISMIANSPSGEFTEQEEKEIVAILSSFRDNSVSSEPTDTPSTPTNTNTITTIDELWELLAGEWSCTEYQYLGKTHDGYEHIMELQYIDGQPCMIRQTEKGHFPDAVFSGFAVDNDTHFKAYTYRKGIDDPSDGNWDDETEAAWYTFDVSELADNKLTVYYYIQLGDFLDNHKFEYVRN